MPESKEHITERISRLIMKGGGFFVFIVLLYFIFVHFSIATTNSILIEEIVHAPAQYVGEIAYAICILALIFGFTVIILSKLIRTRRSGEEQKLEESE